IIFKTIKLFIKKEKTIRYRVLYAAFCGNIILLPVIISLFIYYTHEDKGRPANIIVVQPNIDPYNEKFGGMTSEQQLAKLLNLAKQKTDKNTNLIIGPETAIPEGVWENDLYDSRSVDSLKNYLKKYPQLNILMGLSSYKMYLKGEQISLTARLYADQGWYDAYNSAMMIDTSKKIQIYHKSRLVPGVEKMPYPKIFKSLEKFALDLGGTSGSLGIQDERSVLYSNDSVIKLAPVICYESIYGEFVSEYIQNGANIICIITNDGWWKDTPGYKQHCRYASLRAIETRKCIARSANTGTSCFINQRGDIMQATSWETDDVIKQTVLLNDEKTFYSKYGDYIAKAAIFMSVLIFIYIFFISISRRFRIKAE
ncbi:MAG: apolipoprotein N-acyltransferase, partial [Bacteroidetes bacterium]|nr:apolipoprotein N-acyltransferase [Bacteroidota bacterium]